MWLTPPVESITGVCFPLLGVSITSFLLMGLNLSCEQWFVMKSCADIYYSVCCITAALKELSARAACCCYWVCNVFTLTQGEDGVPGEDGRKVCGRSSVEIIVLTEEHTKNSHLRGTPYTFDIFGPSWFLFDACWKMDWKLLPKNNCFSFKVSLLSCLLVSFYRVTKENLEEQGDMSVTFSVYFSPDW